MKIKKNNLILLLNQVLYLVLIPTFIIGSFNTIDNYEIHDIINYLYIIKHSVLALIVGLIIIGLIYLISRLSLKHKIFKVILKIYYVISAIISILVLIIAYHKCVSIYNDLNGLNEIGLQYIPSVYFLGFMLFLLAIAIFLSLFNLPKIINKENIILKKIDYIPMLINFVLLLSLTVIYLFNCKLEVSLLYAHIYYFYFYMLFMIIPHLLFNIYVVGLLKDYKKEAK